MINRARTIAVLTSLLLAGQAVAQDQATFNERAKLTFLIGNFATETNIPPRPPATKGATGKGTSVISWSLDSAFLMIDEQSMNSVFGQYKGHGMLGYDSPTKQFMLSMFNNFGDHPTYRGNFVGDTLVLETKVPMPGRSFDQKLLWYKDGETVRLKVMNDLGKGFALALEQTYVPVSQKSQ